MGPTLHLESKSKNKQFPFLESGHEQGIRDGEREREREREREYLGVQINHEEAWEKQFQNFANWKPIRIYSSLS